MVASVLVSLCAGFLKTLEIFVFTLVGALPLGLVVCFGSMSGNRVLSSAVRSLIWVVRGTPLMLQLLVVFYGPGLVFGCNIWGGGGSGRMAATLAAFILNYACYFSEIYRGGIESIDKGQFEACAVLGLNKYRTYTFVVLPQVFRRIIPPMANEIITLVKDTSLARIIAVYEIIYEGQSYIKAKGIIWPLFCTGIFYLVLNGALTVLFGRLEDRLSFE